MQFWTTQKYILHIFKFNARLEGTVKKLLEVSKVKIRKRALQLQFYLFYKLFEVSKRYSYNWERVFDSSYYQLLKLLILVFFLSSLSGTIPYTLYQE